MLAPVYYTVLMHPQPRDISEVIQDIVDY